MLNLLKRVSSSFYNRPRIVMRSCQARFGQNFVLSVNFLSLKQAIQACLFDPVYVSWLSDQPPKDRNEHGEMKDLVLNEQWWSQNLETIGLVWPIIQVMRAGERTIPAPGRLLHSMYDAEEILNQATIDNAEGSCKRALAEDILVALNTQHDGFR